MATFTGETKNTATFTQQAKNSATFTRQSKNPIFATAGQYYGFMAFTYAGGEALDGNVTVYTNQTKN